MPRKPKILAMAGSLREGSYNKKLIRAAAKMAEDAGGDVMLLDLAEYPMPIYDGDIETDEGLPDNAKKLKKLFNKHDALLIASPEYNSSVSGVLKNTIDWVSRKESPDEPALRDFTGKVAGIISASPGALGGLRGLYHLREILLNINVLVLPEMQAVRNPQDTLGDDGTISDDKMRAGVERVVKRLVEVAGSSEWGA